jgi:hypothetical protein
VDDRSDRLHELDDAAFESFVRQFAEAVWNGWAVTVSPPSPDRSVDVRLSCGDDTKFLHVEHRPAESPVGAPAVRDLAAIRDRRDFDGATLAATSPITDSARTVAADSGIGVLDGDSLRRLCRELDIEIPDASSGQSERQDALETYAAYWPESLAERAEGLPDAIDGFTAFDHHVRVGDSSTVVDFLLNDRTVVKVRLGETNLLVYVRTGDGFESVIGLSAYRETQPALSDLRADLRPRVERAIERSS